MLIFSSKWQDDLKYIYKEYLQHVSEKTFLSLSKNILYMYIYIFLNIIRSRFREIKTIVQ